LETVAGSLRGAIGLYEAGKLEEALSGKFIELATSQNKNTLDGTQRIKAMITSTAGKVRT